MKKPVTFLSDDKTVPPDDRALAAGLGARAFGLWKAAVAMIAETWPGVFEPEWRFGGQEYGWSLRYRKSRSFCTLIPEPERFDIMIVFGAKERAKVDAIRDAISPRILAAYDATPTFHDGKWVRFEVTAEADLADIARLLDCKRRPRPAT